MYSDIYKIATLYILLISFLTMIITISDKIRARKSKRRIPEITLFLLAFLGGSVSEYITMKLIRHKTLHKRFMIGLPVIIIFQFSIIILFILWQKGLLQQFI